MLPSREPKRRSAPSYGGPYCENHLSLLVSSVLSRLLSCAHSPEAERGARASGITKLQNPHVRTDLGPLSPSFRHVLPKGITTIRPARSTITGRGNPAAEVAIWPTAPARTQTTAPKIFVQASPPASTPSRSASLLACVFTLD